MGASNSTSSNNEEDSNSATELTHNECLDYMMKGSRVIKSHVITSEKQKKSKKTLILDEDKLGFRYEPSVKGRDFKIPILSLKEIRLGNNLHTDEVLHNIPKKVQFATTYTNSEGEEVTNVFAAFSVHVAAIWVQGLNSLMSNAEEEIKRPDPLLEAWLKEAFDAVDVDKNGALTMQEVSDLLCLLNISSQNEDIKTKFQEANIDGQMGFKDGKLTRAEFANFFKKFNTRQEMEVIYNKYRDKNKSEWTPAELMLFLEDEQLACMDEKSVEEIIKEFEPSEELKKNSLLSLQGLTWYLLSEKNDILKDENQDMTQPLAHYFISSSHNTYLLEGQLRGQSSVQAYINAFKQGCKCVELDCWDGDNMEPIIYHGHTLTSKILFKDVVEAVNDYAFCVSDYPVIISIENHCSCQQQTVMAEHLKSILGDKLSINEVEDDLQYLPSPEDLKGKILIKGKKLSSEVECADVVDGAANECFGYVEEENEAEDALQEILTDEELVEKFDLAGDDFKLDELSKEKEKDNKPKKTSKLATELSLLVNYVQSVHFPGLQEALKKQACFKMSSLGESKFTSLAKSSPVAFCDYNKKFLTRTYPSGKRVDSSNYNPVTGWVVGCQIVALNFQTNGVMMDLLRGLFQFNNNCGYVLKPAFLREEGTSFDAEQIGNYENIASKNVSLTVISGQLLPKQNSKATNIVDPYVAVSVYGVKQDTKEKFKTKTIQNNGFNPIWNETFEFVLNAPELALLRFAVLDSVLGKDDLVAQYTLPFSSLKPGYRRLKLLKCTGEEVSHATLFVHTKIN